MAVKTRLPWQRQLKSRWVWWSQAWTVLKSFIRELRVWALYKWSYSCCYYYSYLSGMVMKPVRLLCHMFLLAFLDLIVYNVQKHSQHFELTNQKKYRINLFSHNLGPKIKKIKHKLQHSCFQLCCLPNFITSLLHRTIVKGSSIQELCEEKRKIEGINLKM